MRKSERLFDAITGIRDDLIEKAADGVPKRVIPLPAVRIMAVLHRTARQRLHPEKTVSFSFPTFPAIPVPSSRYPSRSRPIM